MSGYPSQAAVREVIRETLRMEGRDPRDYNITGIMRDAFYYRGAAYGYGANPVEDWTKAVNDHRRTGNGDDEDECAGCRAPSRTICRVCRQTLCGPCFTDHHHEGYGTPATNTR